MHKEEPSLLSHLGEVRTKYFAEGGLSNLIFCGKMRSDSDTAEVFRIHREAIEEEVFNEKSNITGLLVSQGNSVLHFLEGPSASIQRILLALGNNKCFQSVEGGLQPSNSTSSLASPGNPNQAALLQGRIVYNVEDRPQRLYPEWYSCTIPERKSPIDGVTIENCKDVIYDISCKLLEIGKRLTFETQRDDLDIGQ